MKNESAANREAELLRATLRLNSTVLAIVLGLLFGLAIFVATNWLLLMGGHVDEQGNVVVGPHLELLGQYFLGYTVSFAGSVIGFVYGFGLGALTGILIAWVYNRVVDLRT